MDASVCGQNYIGLIEGRWTNVPIIVIFFKTFLSTKLKRTKISRRNDLGFDERKLLRYFVFCQDAEKDYSANIIRIAFENISADDIENVDEILNSEAFEVR